MDNYNPETIRNQFTQQILSHNYEGGPLLLLAGPGTGKTYSLLMTIREQMKTRYSINEFFEVSLTNEAVNDFTIKAKKEINEAFNSSSTLHYKAKGILHRYADTVNLPKDLCVVSGLVETIFYQDLSKICNSSKKIIENKIKKYQEASANCEEVFDHFSNIYRRLQKYYSSIDWYDIVYFVVKILENNPEINNIESNRFEFLLIDEYQDLNNADQRLIELLVNKRNTLLAVGDDDQSIYSNRFANPSGIRNFNCRYPQAKIINLPVTSRLPTRIIDHSYNLISKNENRQAKTKLKPLTQIDKRSNGGFVISIDHKSEKAEREFIGKSLQLLINNGIPPKNILILCNYKRLGSELNKFLHKEHNELPIYNNFSDEDEIENERFLVSKIRKFLSDPSDNLSLRIIIDELESKNKKGISAFVNLAFQKNISLWEACNDDGLLSTTGVLEQLLNKIKRCYLSLHELTDMHKKLSAFINEFSQLEYLNQFVNNNNKNCEDLSPNTDDVKNKIKLITMHSSKGLDADFIFIPFMEESLSLPAIDIEEMRRLLYVVMTRAKVGVVFSWAWSRRSQSRYITSGEGGDSTHRQPSKFLRECGVKPSYKYPNSADEALNLLDRMSKLIIAEDNK
ncbi:MAG: ATP-dependent helicase [Anaerolineaceae bacterium]